MLRPTLLLALILPLQAQFLEVVSTDDGEQVYFNTTATFKNAPRPTGSFSELRAYRVLSSGLELFAERGELARTDAAGSGDGVSSLHISGDGQSVAYTLNQICPPGSDPCNRTVQRAEVRGRHAQILGEAATAWMSRNGEWSLVIPAPVLPSRPGEVPQRPTEATLVNLRTGERAQVPIPVARGNPLTSDGSVLVSGPHSSGQGLVPGLRKGSQFRPIVLPQGSFNPLRISDDGSRLFLLQLPAPGPKLVIQDLSTNTTTVVSTRVDNELTNLLGISNSGEWALVSFVRPEDASRTFELAGRAAVVDTETGRQIDLPLPADELATVGTMSGYGNAAFVFTTAGRLLRFDLDARGNIIRTRELLAPSPYICCGDIRVALGDVTRLNITAPGMADWTGRLRLRNTPLPVLASDASSVTVQIPWDATLGLTEITPDVPRDAPFATAQTAFVSLANPRFVPSEPGSGALLPGLKMIRADFSDYVKTQPQPGQIVHVYMTGLGPVRGAVQTGQPAPLTDIRPIAGDIRCRFLPQAAEAETLFAGLAPGTLGYYIVTMRMPAITGTALLNGLNCQFTTEGYSTSMTYLQLPPPIPVSLP